MAPKAPSAPSRAQSSPGTAPTERPVATRLQLLQAFSALAGPLASAVRLRTLEAQDCNTAGPLGAPRDVTMLPGCGGPRNGQSHRRVHANRTSRQAEATGRSSSDDVSSSPSFVRMRSGYRVTRGLVGAAALRIFFTSSIGSDASSARVSTVSPSCSRRATAL